MKKLTASLHRSSGVEIELSTDSVIQDSSGSREGLSFST